MDRRNSLSRSALCLLLAAGLLAGSLSRIASAQNRKRKPVVVSFGQPNIWSLEQAHYLLARMHMTNLDLRARELGDNDLDPNAVNGTRINIFKQLLEAGVTFNQGVGFQNDLITRNAQFNSNRRLELIADRDRQQSEMTRLLIAPPPRAPPPTEMDSDPSATKEDKAKKDAEIKENKDLQVAVKSKLDFDAGEITSLGAQPSGAPLSPDAVPTPFDKTRLPSSLLDGLTTDKLLDLAKDPKLNASTILDNHVQMQYEIIAKQLTLLRDEVGPGERLVFLELPQSIYTSPGDGDEKLAQTWWHVNGYTRTDPLVRLLLELFEVEQKWHDIQQVAAYQTRAQKFAAMPCEAKTEQDQKDREALRQSDPVAAIFFSLKCEREIARNRVLDKLYREGDTVFARAEQNGARDTSEMVEAIRKVIAIKSPSASGEDKDTPKSSPYVDVRGITPDAIKLSPSISQQTEKKRHDNVVEMKKELLKILSDDKPIEAQGIQDFKKKFEVEDGSEFERGIEFIRLDDTSTPTNIERRTVRTVDIIPRQSSMNVNDLNDTVKAFGLWGSFKFLFGLGGQTSFQRQREQFEQFLHQELYASGFGKGDRDFGWTFGALPGTKRVAPGVRTTYAVLVVPEDAESIVLSARGCYFPRHDNQPLDFADTAGSHWDHTSRNCGDAETYILPVPGGGDTSNFWVTSVEYQSAPKGTRATVSVRGNNFSSQIGVLVDGVPLTPGVGLAQPLLRVAHKGADQTCVPATSICGEFERIDPEQVVFSFSMPPGKDGNDFEGTPTITLIAPGKSVDLNALSNVTVNGKRNVALGDDSNPLIFGARADSPAISDLKVFRASPYSRRVVALLSGTGFIDGSDTVFINGVEMGGAGTGTTKTFVSPQLYRLEFNLPADDSLDVSLIQTNTKAGKKKFKTKSFTNTSALRISKVTVLSYEPPADKRPHGVLIAKLEGAGFNSRLLLHVDGAAKLSRLLDVSPNEAIVRLVDPEASVVVSLLNLASDEAVKTVVTRGGGGQ
jgi:hypothetical protein